MFDPARATWTEERFRFEALNQELVHESNWDERQLVIAQMMTEIGHGFLECYRLSCGEWVRHKEEDCSRTFVQLQRHMKAKHPEMLE